MFASSNGHTVIVRYLVEQGSEKDKAGNRGGTALMAGAHGGHLRVVRYLVEQGVVKDKTDDRGMTALMYAVHEGHFGVVEFLLEDGVDLTKVTTDGRTALHIAAQRGNAEILSLLMAYGASLTARTNDGDLPIDLAANEAIRVLIHDEPSRRMDHGYKRDPNLDPDIEQASKRPRLEGEGQVTASVSAPLTAEELQYEEEVNQDSSSSDEDEIDETKIHYRHIAPDNKSSE